MIGARAGSARLAALAAGLWLGAGCSAPSGLSLPLVSETARYAPVEGLETPGLAARARGAVLSARGEEPIHVRLLPAGTELDHPIRGDVVALAGPAPDGRFVYAVLDERRGVALRRADIRGADRPVARFPRPIHAIALSPDGEHAAILAPFEEEDPRSRGGVLRELVIVDLSSGESVATGFAAWNALPAWIDAWSVACIVAAEDGARSIALVDRRDPASARVVAAGERVVADIGGGALIAFRDDESGLTARRVPLPAGDAVVAADGADRALVLRGSLQPLALAGDDLLVSFSAPTLGVEPQWEFDLFGPRVALATIKLHDLASGAFRTLEPRASPRKLWSAGRLAP